MFGQCAAKELTPELRLSYGNAAPFCVNIILGRPQVFRFNVTCSIHQWCERLAESKR